MKEKICEAIAEALDVDSAKVTEDASFVGDLNADSLDLFELAVSLEDEFSIEIPAEELEKIVTVKDVIDYISSRTGNN